MLRFVAVRVPLIFLSKLLFRLLEYPETDGQCFFSSARGLKLSKLYTKTLML